MNLNPQPLTVFITCMDCRLDPSRFLQTAPGEVFIIRNPGNMVPHFDPAKSDNISGEGGGLELGCIMNGIGDVVVCGHSDCKVRDRKPQRFNLVQMLCSYFQHRDFIIICNT